MCSGLSYNQIQTSALSVSAWRQEMSGMAVVILVVEYSRIRDQRHEASVTESIACVAWTTLQCHWSQSAVLNSCHPIVGDSRQRYVGATPANDWWTSPTILTVIGWQTCSQCSCRSTGVTWSHCRAPVTRCAAMFRTDCTWHSNPSLMRYRNELQ